MNTKHELEVNNSRQNLIEALKSTPYNTVMVSKEDLVRILCSEFKLINYMAGSDEMAVWKNIPIYLLEMAKERVYEYIKSQSSTHGNAKIRIKYRGPRKGNLYHTLKENATHFSIYIDHKNS